MRRMGNGAGNGLGLGLAVLALGAVVLMPMARADDTGTGGAARLSSTQDAPPVELAVAALAKAGFTARLEA